MAAGQPATVYQSTSYQDTSYQGTSYSGTSYAGTPYQGPPRQGAGYPPPNYPGPVHPTAFRPQPYPGQYPPLPAGGSLHPYPQNRGRGRWLPALAVVVAVLMLLGITGAIGVGIASDAAPGAARSVAGRATGVDGRPQPSGRDAAISSVLENRAAAVKAKDKAGFMGDVDPADETFVKKQESVFGNLIELPLADLAYKLNPTVSFDAKIPTAVTDRYPNGTRAPGITITYQITSVDQTPVAVPWVPIFALVDGRWKLVSEVVDKELPSGVGGQPWDAGAIRVEQTGRVVGVFTEGSRDNPRQLLALAESALDRVAKVRPSGWAGKIFLIAVRDRSVFDAYFGDAPERVDQVAAIAVPHYSDVHEWSNSAEYTATRIIFNPDELSEDADQLSGDLAHEFTHAAMAPVTSGWTPTWLVEGFAEYVSYKGQRIDPAALKRVLRGAPTNDLVGGEKFYDEPLNYVTGWLACRMIAEKFGESKLIALYEAFETTSGEVTVVDRTLGISRDELIRQWKAYVEKQRA
jgi:hypothetical protein